MDMLAYLTELIKTHKAVGIPGLGTIYKKKSPGRYDAETHSFLPPSYVLDFSTELQEQVLLVAYICKKRNISPDAAGYFVGQFAEGIHKQLEDHQEADFQPLGTLTNISGALVFKPANDQNFGFDFYGLPALKDEVAGIEIKKPAGDPIAEDIVADADSNLETESPEETISGEDPQEAAEEPVELAEIINPEDEASEETAVPDGDEAVTEPATDTLEAVVIENEIEEENPGAGAAAHGSEIQNPEATQGPEETTTDINQQVPVERAAFPIIAGEDPSTAIDEQEQLSVSKEEISSPIVTPEKPVHHPVIETPEGIETTEEPINFRPTLNEIYAQSVRTAEPAPVQERTPIPERITPADPPVFYNSNAEDADKGKTPLYLKMLIVLLLILIGTAAVYFIRPDLFDSILKRQPAQAALPLDPLSGQEQKPATDSLPNQQDSSKKNIAPAVKDSAKKDTSAGAKQTALKAAAGHPATIPPVKAPATTAQKPVETSAPAQTSTTFEVIGSSVATQKEADRFITQMKSLGIHAKAIPPAPGKKKIKISVATFKDEAAARAERPKLEEKLGIKGLYIHTNKPL